MQQRLDGIQILRFIAAAMVLVQHAVSLPAPKYGFDLTTFFRFQLGGGGVYIFFVISGFVIAGLIEQDPKRFALHRLVRIYPPYLAAMAVAVLIIYLSDAVPIANRNWEWSSTLLPIGGPVQVWTAVPFWTLIYEMTFYMMTAALMIGGKRAFDIGIVAWALVIFVSAHFFTQPRSAANADIFVILTNQCTLLFITGAAFRRLYSGVRWPVAAVALMMWTSFWPDGKYIGVSMFGIGTCAAIYFAVLGSAFISKQQWLSPLVRAGDYSYGLYLIHAPIIVGMIALGLTKAVSLKVAVFLCLIIPGTLGLLFGRADFKFYRNIARKWADGIAATPATSSSSEQQVSSQVSRP